MTKRIDRRDLLQAGLFTAGAGLALTALGSCSDDSAPPAPDKGSDSSNPDSAPPVDVGADAGTPAEMGSDLGGVDASSCVTTGTNVTIGTNHGHALTVPKEDVADAAEKTYDIQGTSAHPHTVTLTAAEFATLASGQSITVRSSFDAGHDHQVTVSCI